MRPTASSSTATSICATARSTTSSAARKRIAGTIPGFPRESNANYGNTVIVWDLLFGTWFLPHERSVQALGLQDPTYPKSFWALMRAPFTVMPGLAFRAAMQAQGARYWWPVRRYVERPDEAQAQVLRDILKANRDTQFGAEHRFAEIQSAEQYRQRVPAQDYETLRPYVERQRCTGAPALTAEAPLFYAQTSGSTGTPKYIPIGPSALRMHRAEQALFTFLQYRACPQAFAGKALGIMGAAVEGHLDSGHHVGSVSGYLYRVASRIGPFAIRAATQSLDDRRLRSEIPGHPTARAVVP